MSTTVGICVCFLPESFLCVQMQINTCVCYTFLNLLFSPCNVLGTSRSRNTDFYSIWMATDFSSTWIYEWKFFDGTHCLPLSLSCFSFPLVSVILTHCPVLRMVGLEEAEGPHWPHLATGRNLTLPSWLPWCKLTVPFPGKFSFLLSPHLFYLLSPLAGDSQPPL